MFIIVMSINRATLRSLWEWGGGLKTQSPLGLPMARSGRVEENANPLPAQMETSASKHRKITYVGARDAQTK